jgi:hypothetical protein
MPTTRGDDGEPGAAGEILFEWCVIGDQARVAAIDPASGIEVVVFGPAQGGLAPLRALARRKLSRRLDRGGSGRS